MTAGPVPVPAALAGPVLRLLVPELRRRVRGSGLRPAAGVVELLCALQRAADAYEREPDGDGTGRARGSESVTEAAARLGCAAVTVRRRLASGRLAGRKTAGGVWLVEPGALWDAEQADHGAHNVNYEREII